MEFFGYIGIISVACIVFFTVVNIFAFVQEVRCTNNLLKAKIKDLGESNVNRINEITKLTNKVNMLEEQNKELQISIEFLREADAEVRFEVFNKGTKSKRSNNGKTK